MKIIIHAEPDEMEYVMGLILGARSTFARHPERIGWGWTFGSRGKRSFFIRQIVGGLSARPANQTVKDVAASAQIEVRHD